MVSAPNRTADAANIGLPQHCTLSGARRVLGKFEEGVAALGPFRAADGASGETHLLGVRSALERLFRA